MINEIWLNDGGIIITVPILSVLELKLVPGWVIAKIIKLQVAASLLRTQKHGVRAYIYFIAASCKMTRVVFLFLSL